MSLGEEPRSALARVVGISRAALLVLSTCIVGGIVLRFSWPNVIAFGGEQIETIVLAYRSWFVETTSRGLRVSVGLDMPPFYLWLMSLPVSVTRDPVRLTQFVTVLNVVALLALWRVLARHVSTLEAALSIALLATSPWMHVFARKIWAQDVLFPATVVWLSILASALARPSAWKTWVFCVVLSLYAQIYPATWFVVPPLLVGVWVARPGFRPRDIAIGLALAALPWVPYALYQSSVAFDDVLYAAATRGSGTEGVLAKSPLAHVLGALGLSGGTGLDWLTGHKVWRAWNEGRVFATSNALAYVFVLLAALSCAWAGWRALHVVHARWRGELASVRERFLAVLAIVFFGVLLEYIVLGLPALPHYHVVLVPAVPIFVACALHAASVRARRSDLAPAAIVGAFALLHSGQWISIQVRLSRALGSAGAHAPIYAHKQLELDHELALALSEDREGPPRRKTWNEGWRAAFEASHEVVFDGEVVCDEFAPTCVSGCDIDASERGFDIVNRRPPGLIDLPRFEWSEPGFPILRLDLETTIEAFLHVAYTTRDAPSFRRDQLIVVRVPRGVSSMFVPLDAALSGGPIRLEFLLYRVTLRHVEARLVAR